MAATRKVVIVGPQPVQVLDVTGPIEVFSNAKGYEVTLATPGPERSRAQPDQRKVQCSPCTPFGNNVQASRPLWRDVRYPAEWKPKHRSTLCHYSRQWEVTARSAIRHNVNLRLA